MASTQSWVEGANEPHGFGLNHLPYGAFISNANKRPHLCVRIGDRLLDLHADGLLPSLPPEILDSLQQSTLNNLLTLGPAAWQTLREHVTTLLSTDANGHTSTIVNGSLRLISECSLTLPIAIGDYTDFYASIHHARRVGELFRPDSPLLPNYKHIPIGYHGRASSIVPSGTAIKRPQGQQRPANPDAQPAFGPSAALDFEAELAFIIGQGNDLGEPIPIDRAHGHIFGVALLNDWSARDIQSWEYQPLGPFLGKSFATSLSPWITPMAALKPFHIPAFPRPEGDPTPLPYLHSEHDQQTGALDIEVTSSLNASRLSRTNTRELYWTSAQMLAHHTSNGCNLRPGDVLATGTLSGADPSSAGCLLELTRGGAQALTLSGGQQRTYLRDGDEILLTARCERDGLAPITVGECRGRIQRGPTS